MIQESHKRTVARMISYRLTAWLTTLPITYWMTGSWGSALGSATIMHLILSVDYYFHERIWLKVKWGLSQQTKVEEKEEHIIQVLK